MPLHYEDKLDGVPTLIFQNGSVRTKVVTWPPECRETTRKRALGLGLG